jgi:hypothetical protein
MSYLWYRWRSSDADNELSPIVSLLCQSCLRLPVWFGVLRSSVFRFSTSEVFSNLLKVVRDPHVNRRWYGGTATVQKSGKRKTKKER